MKKALLVISVIIIAVVVVVMNQKEDAVVLQQGEILQTGSLVLSDSETYTHEVFFTEKFSSLPNIELKLVTGTGYIEVIERRMDGFIMKSSHLGYSVAQGAQLEWTAIGLK